MDTAADRTIAPFSLARSLGIRTFEKVENSVYSFDKKKCNEIFAGQKFLNVRINDKDFTIKILFLKPNIGANRVLLGLDILTLTPFDLSFNNNRWNFRFKTREEIAKGQRFQIYENEFLPNQRETSVAKVHLKCNEEEILPMIPKCFKVKEEIGGPSSK